MIINRQDIEVMVNAIIDERLKDIADTLRSADPYSDSIDRVIQAIRWNINEDWNKGNAEFNRLHEETKP